jgi:D-inositol-3-phosphate glycosyltransferase
MRRLAILSLHGCPVARLGEKDTGGMNVYVLQVAKELAERGYLVDVYTRCHDPQDPQVVELADGARVVHIKAGPYDTTKESLYEYIPEFLSNLHRFQQSAGVLYDLIHSHYWLSGRVGVILSQRWKVPHVVTFHTLAKTKLRARAGEIEPQWRISAEKIVSQSADAIVVTTAQEQEDLSRLYGIAPSKVHVIPAGVDLELFRPVDKDEARQALGLREDKVILYVGRIEPLKGLDVLVGALPLLEDPENTRLLVVGGKPGQDAELKRLKSFADGLGIGGKVTFTGAVEQDRLPVYYGAADAFVLPSYYESFGLVALEAMACGTPVVVSRVGGLKTFIKNGETGYLIPWHCPEPFAQRLDMLLENPSLREKMGNAARADALKMSWRGVAEQTSEFYTSLVDRTLESLAGA